MKNNMSIEKIIEILDHNWTKIVNPDYTEDELTLALNSIINILKINGGD